MDVATRARQEIGSGFRVRFATLLLTGMLGFPKITFVLGPSKKIPVEFSKILIFQEQAAPGWAQLPLHPHIPGWIGFSAPHQGPAEQQLPGTAPKMHK